MSSVLQRDQWSLFPFSLGGFPVQLGFAREALLQAAAREGKMGKEFECVAMTLLVKLALFLLQRG